MQEDEAGLNMPVAWYRLLAESNLPHAGAGQSAELLQASDVEVIREWATMLGEQIDFEAAATFEEAPQLAVIEVQSDAPSRPAQTGARERNRWREGLPAAAAILVILGGVYLFAFPRFFEAKIANDDSPHYRRAVLAEVALNDAQGQIRDLERRFAEKEKALAASREGIIEAEKKAQALDREKKELIARLAQPKRTPPIQPPTLSTAIRPVVDLTKKLALPVVASSAAWESLSPAYSSILETKPTLRWKTSGMPELVRIEIFRIGTRTRVWRSEPIDGSAGEARDVPSLERGVSYEWVIVPEDMDPSKISVPFYVLSEDERRQAQSELRRAKTDLERLAVFRRYALNEDARTVVKEWQRDIVREPNTN